MATITTLPARGVPAIEKGWTYVPSAGVAATDTANIQAAHDALPAGGGSIFLDAGPYILTAGTVNFTKPIHLIGTGPSGANAANGSTYLTVGTAIQCASQTGVAIQVNADGCTFEKIYFKNTYNGTPTAGAAVQVQSLGKSTRIVDCTFNLFYVGFDFQYGYEWFLTRCHFIDCVYAGLKINDAYSGDAGDAVVSDSFFIAGPTNLVPQAGIRWESGGALKVTGCKFNGRGGTTFVSGLDYKVQDGVSTEGPYVAACSFESCAQGIDVGQAGPSNTGTLIYMTVAGCQFGSISNYGIRVKPGFASLFIQKVTVTGCALSGTTGGVYVERTNLGTFVGNAPVGGTTPPLVWGSGTTNLTYDQSMSVQATLNGTTAGTAISSQVYVSPFAKKFMVRLNGYRNSTGVVQSIFPPVGFSGTPVVTHDDSGGATFDTAVRLPTSMGAPVTGIITVEGY